MKHRLKWIYASFLLLIVLCILMVCCGSLSDPLPKGKQGPLAERLADRMLERINLPAFEKAQGAKWQFRSHHYLWHRGLHRVRVTLSDDLIVYLDLNQQQGWSLEEGKRSSPIEESNHVKAAIKAFNNDSFWAFAPFKVRDSGTSRALVNTKNGQALLVFYKSGGSTPGDHYLWHLDQNDRPTSWQMWVSIIPLGGVSSTWSGWVKTSSGAWVATKHKTSLLDLEIQDIEVTTRFESLEERDEQLVGTWPENLSK
jgi:hypothetical protein